MGRCYPTRLWTHNLLSYLVDVSNLLYTIHDWHEAPFGAPRTGCSCAAWKVSRLTRERELKSIGIEHERNGNEVNSGATSSHVSPVAGLNALVDSGSSSMSIFIFYNLWCSYIHTSNWMIRVSLPLPCVMFESMLKLHYNHMVFRSLCM